MTGRPTAVALVGAEGHGVWHRRVLHRLAAEGRVRLVGLCDRRPVAPADGAPLGRVPVFTEHTAMLAALRPEVVIVCTPPHTHLPIALDCLGAGADLLLEKPPVATLAEHRRLAAALRDTGRACQVGFQALGSAALAEVTAAAAGGALGTVGAISAVGAWWRPDRYFRRAAWAGRRFLDGRPVVDGALVNPFAHALMQALAVADAAAPDGPAPGCGAPGGGHGPVAVELERYRSRGIDVDDVTFLRVRFTGGLRLVAAVTVAASRFLPGEVGAAGTLGRARLEYPTDRVRLPADRGWRDVPGRVDLLENLLAHRGRPDVPLIAPLARTARFTALVEAVTGAPPPTPVPDRYLSGHPEGGGRVVDGIADLVCEVGERGELPSELGVPWATAPWRGTVACCAI